MLTDDVNYLEKLKATNRIEAEKINSTETNMEKQLSLLIELLEPNHRLVFECALSVFSIKPTPVRFAGLKTLHSLLLPEHMNRDATNSFGAVSTDSFGISQQVIESLAAVVKSCRCKSLYWQNDWDSL